jgi:hypothetical protein
MWTGRKWWVLSESNHPFRGRFLFIHLLRGSGVILFPIWKWRRRSVWSQAIHPHLPLLSSSSMGCDHTHLYSSIPLWIVTTLTSTFLCLHAWKDKWEKKSSSPLKEMGCNPLSYLEIEAGVSVVTIHPFWKDRTSDLHLFACVYVCLSVCLSACLSVGLSVCMAVCLSVCMYVYVCM